MKKNRLLNKLHLSNEKLASFFSETSDAINITNINGELIFINSSFEQIFGWKRNELIGKHLPVIPKNLREKAMQMRSKLLEGQSISKWEEQFVKKDGSLIDVSVSIYPLKDSDGALTEFVAITRDISEQKKYEKKLQSLAYFDSITGVSNRKYFYKRLDWAMKSGPFALLYLDCDNFKWINDTFGHNLGDKFLFTFVRRIKASIVSTGGTISRLGGDEFAIIIPKVTSYEEIADIAERILRDIQTPLNNYKLTCSIGISVYPSDCEDQKTLLSGADYALDQAKSKGGNCFRFFKGTTSE